MDQIDVGFGTREPEIDCCTDKLADGAVLALCQSSKPMELRLREEYLKLFHGYSISMEARIAKRLFAFHEIRGSMSSSWTGIQP
jgi:hypothetical protein